MTLMRNLNTLSKGWKSLWDDIAMRKGARTSFDGKLATTSLQHITSPEILPWRMIYANKVNTLFVNENYSSYTIVREKKNEMFSFRSINWWKRVVLKLVLHTNRFFVLFFWIFIRWNIRLGENVGNWNLNAQSWYVWLSYNIPKIFSIQSKSIIFHIFEKCISLCSHMHLLRSCTNLKIEEKPMVHIIMGSLTPNNKGRSGIIGIKRNQVILKVMSKIIATKKKKKQRTPAN